MKKHVFMNATKMLLIPTLIIGGLSACGYGNNDGARTNMYDGAATYNRDVNNLDGVRPYATGRNNSDYGMGTTRNNGNNFDYGMGTTRNNRTNDLRMNQRVATRVIDIAQDIPGVNRATAIVYGNDIVVGIDDRNRNQARKLERTAHQAIKSNFPTYNVHVTADDNIITRIRNINSNANNYSTNGNNNNFRTPGHPVRDLGTDITMVIRDIGRTVTAPFR